MSGTKSDTTAALVQHATKYGTEGVVEAGAELGLSFEKLVALQKVVDRLDSGKKRGRFTVGKKHRLSAETRVKRLLGITDEEEE